MKRSIVIIVLLLVIGAEAHYFIKQNNKLKNIVITSEIATPILSRQNSFFKKRIHKDIAWYKTVDYDYPIGDIPGMTTVQIKINEEITNLICNNDIDRIAKDDLEGIKNSPNGDLDCSLSINYSNTSNGHLITHVLDENFYDGGPRTFYSVKTFTFDEQGKEYKILDLIKDEKTEDVVLDLIRVMKESFLNQYDTDNYFSLDKQFFLDLITPKTVNDIPFQIETDKITFIFTEAEGLGHSTGVVLISVPTKELKDILQQKFFPKNML